MSGRQLTPSQQLLIDDYLKRHPESDAFARLSELIQQSAVDAASRSIAGDATPGVGLSDDARRRLQQAVQTSLSGHKQGRTYADSSVFEALDLPTHELSLAMAVHESTSEYEYEIQRPADRESRSPGQTAADCRELAAHLQGMFRQLVSCTQLLAQVPLVIRAVGEPQGVEFDELQTELAGLFERFLNCFVDFDAIMIGRVDGARVGRLDWSYRHERGTAVRKDVLMNRSSRSEESALFRLCDVTLSLAPGAVEAVIGGGSMNNGTEATGRKFLITGSPVFNERAITPAIGLVAIQMDLKRFVERLLWSSSIADQVIIGHDDDVLAHWDNGRHVVESCGKPIREILTLEDLPIELQTGLAGGEIPKSKLHALNVLLNAGDTIGPSLNVLIYRG
jgi:hypothetical protein